MKAKSITFFVGFIVMGLAYGAILYFFREESSTQEIIYQALIFGFGWGLAEVFVFPWIRKHFGKEKK
jgi:glucose uptake protein GlcU